MIGFLAVHAPAKADFNLMAEIAMGLVLLGGFGLARKKQYRAHKFCQATVMLLNLPLIAFIMLPSFHDNVQPQLPSGFSRDSFYTVATIHAAVGAVAQLLGLYILLVAATNLLPERLRFHNFKLWMRTQLTLWWIVIGLGIGVYYVWYVAQA